MTNQVRWLKGVTPELEKHALEILGETPDVKKKGLEDLRRFVKEKGLNLRSDDIFLLRFLRAKKFDVPRASRALIAYYKFLEKQSALFTRKTPAEVKEFLDMNFILLHPFPLPDGSLLAFLLAGNFDYDRGSQQDMVSTTLTVGELSLEHEAAQIVGITRILDFKNISYKHCVQFLTPSFLFLVCQVLQDSWPERILAIHILHEPTVISMVAKLIMPLLKKKLRERIHFHGDNIESVHQYVPKEYLPEELGGSMGPFDCTEYNEYLKSHEDFFKKNKEYGLHKKTET